MRPARILPSSPWTVNRGGKFGPMGRWHHVLRVEGQHENAVDNYRSSYEQTYKKTKATDPGAGLACHRRPRAVILVGGGGAAPAAAGTLPPEAERANEHQRLQQAAPRSEPTWQTEPEPCLTPAASVVSSGRIAAFEVYWDAENQTLVNTPPAGTDRHGRPGDTRRWRAGR